MHRKMKVSPFNPKTPHMLQAKHMHGIPGPYRVAHETSPGLRDALSGRRMNLTSHFPIHTVCYEMRAIACASTIAIIASVRLEGRAVQTLIQPHIGRSNSWCWLADVTMAAALIVVHVVKSSFDLARTSCDVRFYTNERKIQPLANFACQTEVTPSH